MSLLILVEYIQGTYRMNYKHAGIFLVLGLVFLLFLCRTENLIIQWASENVLIEIWHVFNIYYSGIGASKVVQIQKLVLLSGVCTK